MLCPMLHVTLIRQWWIIHYFTLSHIEEGGGSSAAETAGEVIGAIFGAILLCCCVTLPLICICVWCQSR